MSHNPEKEKQVPETVTERRYDKHEARLYGCGVIEHMGLLPITKIEIEKTPVAPMPDIPVSHSAEVIDLAAERLLREARQNVEAA